MRGGVGGIADTGTFLPVYREGFRVREKRKQIVRVPPLRRRWRSGSGRNDKRWGRRWRSGSGRNDKRWGRRWRSGSGRNHKVCTEFNIPVSTLPYLLELLSIGYATV